MADPTEEELKILVKFRQKLSDLNLNEFMRTDMVLLQWLRARDLHLGKAEEMLRKSLKWRQEIGFDSILNWQPPPEFLSQTPLEIGGYDAENVPSVFIPYGRWDLRQIFNGGYRDTYIRFCAHFCATVQERMKGKVTSSGQRVTQFILICDVEGLSFRTLTSVGAISMAMEATRNLEQNFPEIMKKIIVYNASRVFTAFFALCKPVLSQRTFGKIEIYGRQPELWRKAVLDAIPMDQFPKMMLESWNTSLSNVNGEVKTGPIEVDKDEDDLENDVNSYTAVSVAPGTKLPIQFEVKAPGKSLLTWSFQSDKFDIGFSLIQGSTVIVPYSQVNSHLEEQEGTIICEKGLYTFLFDNSYSRVRGKVLKYRITNVPVGPEH